MSIKSDPVIVVLIIYIKEIIKNIVEKKKLSIGCSTQYFLRAGKFGV